MSSFGYVQEEKKRRQAAEGTKEMKGKEEAPSNLVPFGYMASIRVTPGSKKNFKQTVRMSTQSKTPYITMPQNHPCGTIKTLII